MGMADRLIGRARWAVRILTAPEAASTKAERVCGAPPPAGAKVCLFVSYAPSGALLPHVEAYVRALRGHGWHVTLVLAMDDLAVPVDPSSCGGADIILRRANHGYDFAAWSAALRACPEAWNASLLLFANDSVYPLLGPAFSSTLLRVEESAADVRALVGSNEVRPHFQSFFFAYGPRALADPGMRRFWRRMRAWPKKSDVIRCYELTQMERLRRRGLSVELLHPAPPDFLENPSLDDWRRLLQEGFPFMKVQLLRDARTPERVAGWPEAARDGGGDLAAMERHLSRVAPDGPALAALRTLSQEGHPKARLP